ncbi:MAG: hypothetical protein ACM33T_00240 [Solirubrobacterales bacterium]
MSRTVLIAFVGLGAAILAIVLFVARQAEEVLTAASTPGPAAASVAPAPITHSPSFDVVRIGAEGDAVMAGRAQAKSDVFILEDGHELGHVVADARGEWVFVPELPIAPGTHSFSIREARPDGSVDVSASPVILVVPGQAGQPPLAIKPLPGGGAKLLLPPGGYTPALAVETAEDTGDGRLVVSGRAPAGASVHLILDNRPAGRGLADTDGSWTIGAPAPAAGRHSVAAEQVDGKGKVVRRAEVAYEAASLPGVDDGVTVRPGDGEWRMTRRVDGRQTSATIYRFNGGATQQ